jgi:hypothetical protein
MMSAVLSRPSAAGSRAAIRCHRRAARHRRRVARPRARLRPAAAVGHRGAAGVRPGDGLFGLHRDAGQPALRRYAHTHFLVRHRSRWRSPSSWPAPFQVPVRPGSGGALAVRRLAAAADRGADPHIGKGVNGARRWISLGFMNFQPSELAKFAVLLYAANYMVRKMDVKERFFRAVLPMARRSRWSACCCWPSRTWAPSW